MNKLYLSIGVALFLIGCGSNNNEKSTSGEKQEKISIPKKIDMDFPKALKNGKTSKKVQKRAVFNKEIDSNEDDMNSLNKSRGYTELKDNIAEVESNKKELEVNLLLADKIMPQIQEKCQYIPLETTCTIESGELSFIFDKPLMREINTILGDNDPLSDFEERAIKLGKSTFTQYGEKKDFQYALSLDMTPLMGDTPSINKSIQTIKWSKDEDYIHSIYEEKGEDYSSVFSIRYIQKDNGEMEMKIDDTHKDVMMEYTSSNGEYQENGIAVESEGEFHFKLTNLNEEYKISSNVMDKWNDEKMISTSIGEIGKKGGYLKFRGVFDNSEYREKDIFDANGNSIATTYCDASEECSLDDESTWVQLENYMAIDEEEMLELSINDVEMVELSVIGGNLEEDKQYILLAPESTIDGKTAEEIFDMAIGDIYVDNDYQSRAILYDNSYLDMLDSLVIVEISMKTPSEVELNDDLEGNRPDTYDLTFNIVTTNDRPTFAQE